MRAKMLDPKHVSEMKALLNAGEKMGVPLESILKKKTIGNATIIKKIICYYAYKKRSLNCGQIALAMNIDHSTVLFHSKYLEGIMEAHPDIKETYLKYRKIAEDELVEIHI